MLIRLIFVVLLLLACCACSSSTLGFAIATPETDDDGDGNDNDNDSTSHSLFDFTKTYFLKAADKFYVASQSALNLHNALPVGSYTVGFDEFRGEFFLKQILPFNLTDNKKLYGDTTRHGQRILQTFESRNGQSTGVLLAGQKGSGKTLLAKYVSVQAARRGISTIVINEPWSGERFNAFIQSIQQPTIVLFDEFEKVYRQSEKAELVQKKNSDDSYRHYHGSRLHRSSNNDGEISNPSQDAILTLLDGVYPSPMLFLLTVNDKKKITMNMMNRPGRIYYVLDFSGLDAEFIQEYCHDNLRNQTGTVDVVALASLFDAFSFDMLQALVAEMNFHNETVDDAMKWLNVELTTSETKMDTFLIRELVVNGKDITSKIHRPTWYGNPVTDNMIEINAHSESMFGYTQYSVYFSPRNHLVSGNVTSGEYVLEDPQKRSKAVLMKAQSFRPTLMASLLVH